MRMTMIACLQELIAVESQAVVAGYRAKLYMLHILVNCRAGYSGADDDRFPACATSAMHGCVVIVNGE